jgi:alkylhydroperoxidase/carboxymuconolactone decarboxylase family protein YurZ
MSLSSGGIETVDEKTKLLVSLGAAVAANCIPCFAYYYEKALASALSSEDIAEAVEIAYKIKNNINMLMKNSLRNVMGQEGKVCGKANPTCG